MNGAGGGEERPEELQERIRKLAYAMWEAGGCQHGRALEYWLEAERQILASIRAESQPPAKDEQPAAKR